MKHTTVFVILMVFLLAITAWITSLGKVGVYRVFSGADIAYYAWVHLKMVLISVLIASAIAVPAGIVITRPGMDKISSLVIGGANIGQTIPSLAVISIMAPILGFGLQSAIAALVVYGLLPIVRNTYAGIKNIDPAIIEAAKGMGMSRLQITWKIEVPLATKIILAGIRISTVITVGTAELAVLVGGESLGTITLTGVYAREPLLILQGAAPTAAMAIILGWLLTLLEERLTVRGMKTQPA
jgi:osmoprotectant transport system permease protein